MARGYRAAPGGGVEVTEGKPPSEQVSYIVRTYEWPPFHARLILWLGDVQAETER